MRKPFKTLVIAGLALAVVYATAKAYMYYRVKRTLDEAAVQVAGHGSLTRGAIDTDLRGRVTVHDLRFQPIGAEQAFAIRRLHVSGFDMLGFLDPRESWDADQGRRPPPRLRVHLEELTVPQGGEGVAAGGDGCRGDANDPALLAALGIERPVIDSELDWNLDDSAGRLDARVALEIRDMQSIQADLELGKVSFDPEGQLNGMPELRAFELRLRVEPRFANQLALECGRRRGVGPDEFKAQLLAEHLAAAQALGLQLGTGLRFALEQFYAEWGEVRFSGRPKAPVGLLSLVFGPPERLPDTLNLHLQVNDAAIADLGFTWQPPADGPASFAALLGAEPAPSGRPAAPRRQRLESYWVDVAPGGLAGHLRRDVRLHIADGPPREGMLEALRGGVATVRQRVHNGYFTAYVELKDVRRAEVQLQRVIERDQLPQQAEAQQAEPQQTEAATE